MGPKLNFPPILVVHWVSSCLTFFLSASTATYIFIAPTCRTTIISLKPCALNAEFQHFMLRFNKISFLCRYHWKGGERVVKTGWLYGYIHIYVYLGTLYAFFDRQKVCALCLRKFQIHKRALITRSFKPTKANHFAHFNNSTHRRPSISTTLKMHNYVIKRKNHVFGTNPSAWWWIRSFGKSTYM